MLLHFACALLADYTIDVPIALLKELAERNRLTPGAVAREHEHVCRLLWPNIGGRWHGEPAVQRVAALLDVPGRAYLPTDCVDSR